ncbi:MAG: hypothetical protein V1859_03200 [archaeon]
MVIKRRVELVLCIFLLISFFSLLLVNASDCTSCADSCLLTIESSGELFSLRIENVTALPAAATSSGNITVSADIIDALGVTSSYAEITLAQGILIANLTMNDNGLFGDAIADDNKYTAYINATQLFESDYYVTISAVNSIGQNIKKHNATKFSISDANLKNNAKYTGRKVFLISDSSWKDVLPLVPIAIWTQNNSVVKYPLLLYHLENYTDRTLYIDNNELMATKFYFSWGVFNQEIARGTTAKDEFSIVFNLTDEMYNYMQKAIPRADLNVTVEKINSNASNYAYDVYLNGVLLSQRYFSTTSGTLAISPLIGGNEKYLLKKTNNITLKMTGTYRITSYVLFSPYFATDTINSNCLYSPDSYTIYDICISKAISSKVSIVPGESFSYTITLKNIGNETVDLSNTYTKLMGIWHTPGELGKLYTVPHSLMLSHVKTTLPKTTLGVGESADAQIELIYNQGSSISAYPYDADSTITFLQDYLPDSLTISGFTPAELDNLLIASPTLGAGLSSDKIKRITTNDYLSYWNNYKEVVYSNDDYETALYASIYASLLNAPLIIKGTSLDKPNVFENKKKICINTVGQCFESYSITQLKAKYKNLTNTDKLLAINPNDLSLGVTESFKPKKSAQSITTTFGKTSLAAPILASARQELLTTVTSTDLNISNTDIKKDVGGMKFLTIFASPKAIPQREYIMQLGGYGNYKAVDHTKYADTNNDNKPDLFAGRIQGITTSDVTSYLARDLFYSRLSPTHNVKFMASSFSYMISNTQRYASAFSAKGYNTVAVTNAASCYNFNPSEWSNQRFISYMDHGSENWAGINSKDIPKLDNSIVFNDACSTCASYNQYSFCNLAIRQGGIAHMGAVCIAWTGNYIYRNTMSGLYYDNLTLGEAFQKGYVYDQYDYMTTLVGDPAFMLNPPYKLSAKLT